MNRRVQVGAFAAALIAAGLTSATARAAGVSGVVLSVDAPANRLVVSQTGGAQNVDLVVGAQTRITTERGQPLRLADLKRGDSVGVMVQGVNALSIVVRQGPLTGTVTKVDPDGSSFDMTAAGSKVDVTVPVTPTTAVVSVGGATLSVNGLKTGDGVSVTYQGTAVARVVVNPKPQEITGHVKSVAANLKSLVVTEIGSGSDVTVAVNAQTVIVTEQGKTIALKDLKKGDGVGIAHDASVASRIVVNPK